MNRIKTGDNVVVLSGKDRGKQGKVLRMFTKTSKALVEGVALVKRRQKPRKQGEKGQIIERPSAVDLSNVQLYCSKCKKGVRVGFEGEGNKKVRVCVKCKSKL